MRLKIMHLAAGVLLTLAGTIVGAQGVPTTATTGVRPGDLISVWVWRETSLTGEFLVDGRGRVILPMLGEVLVTGKSTDSLIDEIQASFRAYLMNPSIRVSVVRRVAVQGQVGNPGLYPVEATMTIGNVIAMAGGVSANGNPRKILLRRDGRIIETSLGSEQVLEHSAVQSGDEIFISQLPWIFRHGSLLLGTGLSVIAGVAVALILR